MGQSASLASRHQEGGLRGDSSKPRTHKSSSSTDTAKPFPSQYTQEAPDKDRMDQPSQRSFAGKRLSTLRRHTLRRQCDSCDLANDHAKTDRRNSTFGKRMSFIRRANSNSSKATPQPSQEMMVGNAVEDSSAFASGSNVPIEPVNTGLDELPQVASSEATSQNATPTVERPDPLAAERSRAIQTIAQLCPEAIQNPVDRAPEPVVREATLEDHLEPPIRIIPIAQRPHFTTHKSDRNESREERTDTVSVADVAETDAVHSQDNISQQEETYSVPCTPSSIRPCGSPTHSAIPFPENRSNLPSYLAEPAPPSHETTPQTDNPASEQSQSDAVPSLPASSTEQGILGRRIMVQGIITTQARDPADPAEDLSATSSSQPEDGLMSAETPGQEPTTISSDPASELSPTQAAGFSDPITGGPRVVLNPAAQAVLVARLLSVATAAAAASLLPSGTINIGGERIEPFPGLAGEEPSVARPPSTQGADHAETRPRRPNWFSSLPFGNRSSSSASRHRRATSPSDMHDGRDVVGETAGDSQLIVSRPSLMDQPFPNSNAQAGSFERFLSDLQSDIGVALLREMDSSQRPGMTAARSTEGERDAASADDSASRSSAANPSFAFYRSYRFPDRPLDDAANPPEDSGPAYASSRLSVPQEAAARPAPVSTHTDVMPGSFSSSPSQTAASSPLAEGLGPEAAIESEESAATTALSVTPLLLVGIRSMAPGDASTSEAPISNLFSDDSSIVPTQGPNGSDGVDNNREQDDRAAEAESPSRTANGRQWLIWISAGIYPSNHPILTIPQVFARLDDLSYEDMLRLATLIGQVKSPTVTKAELEASGLRIVRGGPELSDLVNQDKVLINTVERCLVCLSDYEREDQIRLLRCKHAFHKECVDRWLETSSNTCPCCRTEAVIRKPKTERTQDSETATTTDDLLHTHTDQIPSE